MATDPRFTPSGNAATGGGERSLSSWLGCGCAGIVTLVMLVVVLVTFLTYRAGQRMEEMINDPERAAAAVAEVVPYDELPAGYHPVGALHVPWMMDVAILAGPGEPGSRGDAAGQGDAGAEDGFEQGFFFVRVRDWFGRSDDAEGWLEGGGGDDAPIEQEELRFDPEEVVDRGELTAGDATVSWVTRRGQIQIEEGRLRGEEEGSGGVVQIKGHGEDDDSRPGLLNLMSIRCSGDEGWQRLGIWFVPDPAPDVPTAEFDWTGTPADPDAIEAFLGHFRLCT